MTRMYTPAELTADDLRLIEAIHALRERLRLNLGRPRRWSGQLRRYSRARAIRGSNSIEGIDVSKDVAYDIVAGDDENSMAEAGLARYRAITGYADAMTYAQELAGEPGFGVDETLIRALHFMVQKYDLDKRPGRYRVGAIYVHDDDAGVAVYEGPGVELVPQLMDAYVEELASLADSGLPPMVQAAMAHLNLVMIHPFADGNGRMARIMQSLVLYREGVLEPEFVSVEENLAHNTQAYYDILAVTGGGRWNPEGDTASWLAFTLTAHYRQALTVLRRIRLLEEIARKVDELAEAGALPARAVPAVEHSLAGYRLRNSTYRELTAVSPNVATRELTAMTREGVLERRGEKRGSWYLPVESLRSWRDDLLREVQREIPIGADPYDLMRRDRPLAGE